MLTMGGSIGEKTGTIPTVFSVIIGKGMKKCIIFLNVLPSRYFWYAEVFQLLVFAVPCISSLGRWLSRCNRAQSSWGAFLGWTWTAQPASHCHASRPLRFNLLQPFTLPPSVCLLCSYAVLVLTRTSRY